MKHPIKPQPNSKPNPSPGGVQPRFKPQPGYIRLSFTLTHADYHIINKCAAEKGLGKHDKSAALSLILREWKAWVDRQHHPILIAVPPDMLPSKDLPEGEA